MPNNPYPKSNMPPARPTTGVQADRQPAIQHRTIYDATRAVQTARNKGAAIIVPEDRSVSYPSMAKYTVVAVPRPDSDLRMGRFDQVRALDIPRHIVERTRQGLSIHPSEGASVLNFYVATMKGLALFDGESQAHLEGLARQFSGNPSEESLKGIENFMSTLTPEARGGAE